MISALLRRSPKFVRGKKHVKRASGEQKIWNLDLAFSNQVAVAECWFSFFTWVSSVRGYLQYVGIFSTWVSSVRGYLQYLGIFSTWVSSVPGYCWHTWVLLVNGTFELWPLGVLCSLCPCYWVGLFQVGWGGRCLLPQVWVPSRCSLAPRATCVPRIPGCLFIDCYFLLFTLSFSSRCENRAWSWYYFHNLLYLTQIYSSLKVSKILFYSCWKQNEGFCAHVCV